MEGSHRMGGPRLVPRLGGKPRLPLEDADEGMELPVQLSDSPEIEIDKLARRGLARREGLARDSQVRKGSPAEVSFMGRGSSVMSQGAPSKRHALDSADPVDEKNERDLEEDHEDHDREDTRIQVRTR
jgi:hypothetical protein